MILLQKNIYFTETKATPGMKPQENDSVLNDTSEKLQLIMNRLQNRRKRHA